jgi:hypothetical protein
LGVVAILLEELEAEDMLGRLYVCTRGDGSGVGTLAYHLEVDRRCLTVGESGVSLVILGWIKTKERPGKGTGCTHPP